MNTRTKPKSFMSLRKKLFSAAAMLLVASIMLVSTSYAWLVLSTAPEITGVTTQMGANGALEIVLLDTESYADLTKIQEMDIDESLTDEQRLAAEANLQWGNLVDLGNSKYGLSNVVLNPSRLAISRSGNDAEGNVAHSVSNVLLKTPVYNEDGRIVDLEETAVTSVYENEKFPVGTTAEYGVRAIGVAANMSEAQLGVNTARNALANHMAAARTAASRALTDNGNALASIAVKYVSNSKATFTSSEAAALRTLAEGLQDALNELESAVRQVYIAYVYTLGLEGDAFTAAKTEAETAALSTLKNKYSGVAIPGARAEVGGDIITLLEDDQTTVQNSINECKELEKQDSISAGDILDAMKPLVNHELMTLGGQTISELAAGGMDEIIQVVMDSGMNLEVPTGSGILSDIADFAGDYTAKVVVDEVSYGDYNLKNVSANMATKTTVNPIYLTSCSNLMMTFNTDSSESSGTVITDFYGYAIDLGFRINTSNANLLLQTDSAQRIYSESTNEATQGGGSYMEYEPKANLSATKMIKMMSGIRVVFMDKTQNVLGIAALDTTLERDDYQLAVNYSVVSSLTVGEGTESIAPSAENCANYKATISESEYNDLSAKTAVDTGSGKYVLGKDAYTQKLDADETKYAVLKGVSNPQNSDYITKTAFEALTLVYEKDDYRIVDGATDEQYAVLKSVTTPTAADYITKAVYDALHDTGAVVIDSATGKIKAKLYLYDFYMVESEAEHEDTSKTYYTGAIKLSGKKASSTITALEENVPKQVTALVYLDGSVVNNSMVAAEGGYSMTGVLNLQFASDVMLTPMNNQELFDGADEETTSSTQTEQTSGTEASGDSTNNTDTGSET